MLGQMEVEVTYGDQSAKLPLTVELGEGPSLFGKDWKMKIQLNWKEIYTVATDDKLAELFNSRSTLFELGLGTLNDYKAKIFVDPNAKSKFCKAHPVPYSMKTKVEEELEQLEKESIIEPLQYAEWVAPIVPVLKSDGKSLRLCGDLKVMVIKASKLDFYISVAKVDNLFAMWAHGEVFSKLCMCQAYQQIFLDDHDDSKKYVVVNAHSGLFCYIRLSFGNSLAPKIFQRV